MPEDEPKAADKGPPPTGEGLQQTDKDGPNGVVEDVFRRVSGLGGFLIVAFVAPMAGSGGNGSTARQGALSAVAREAKEVNRELAAMLASNVKARQKADKY